MKSSFEQEDAITFTTITERLHLPYLEIETIKDHIHLKLYPNDSDTFSFSVNNQFLIYQYRILDQFLISQEICSNHVTSLISDMKLRPCIQHYLVECISTSAIHWNSSRHSLKGGYRIEINLRENVNRSLGFGNCHGRDVLSSPVTELSSAMSRMELGCSEFVTKMKIIYEQDHVTTWMRSNEQIKGCFMEKQTTEESIHIKSGSIELGLFCLSLTFERNQEIRHGNLEGHKINIVLDKPCPISNHEHITRFPFLESEETCYDHLTIVVSEMQLRPATQEYVVRFISQLILHSSSFGLQGKGLAVEVNVKTKVNIDISLDSGSCSRDSSPIPAIVVRETECPICLNELLSGEVSRMELPCSHVFHRDCMMTWLKNKSTCPICRGKVRGETVSIF